MRADGHRPGPAGDAGVDRRAEDAEIRGVGRLRREHLPESVVDWGDREEEVVQGPDSALDSQEEPPPDTVSEDAIGEIAGEAPSEVSD